MKTAIKAAERTLLPHEFRVVSLCTSTTLVAGGDTVSVHGITVVDAAGNRHAFTLVDPNTTWAVGDVVTMLFRTTTLVAGGDTVSVHRVERVES